MPAAKLITQELYKKLELPKIKAEEKKAKEDEAAAKADLDKVLAEQKAMQEQIAAELETGKQQITKTKQETELTQRELGERKLSRVRARVRTFSRPMLSKGVTL